MNTEITERECAAEIVYWALVLHEVWIDGFVDVSDVPGSEAITNLVGWIEDYARITGVSLTRLPQWYADHRLDPPDA